MAGSDFACFQNPLQIHALVEWRSRRAQFICCGRANAEEKQTRDQAKRRTKRKPMASSNARSIADVHVGDEFIGSVCDVGPAESSWLDIDVATLSGRKVNARLRLSQVGTSKGAITGSLVPVYVHKVNRASARIEVRPGSVAAGKDKAVATETRMLDSIQLGEHMEGTVVGLGPYGAVIDVNVYRIGKKGRRLPITGLLPRKCFKPTWASKADLVIRDDVENVVKIGDRIDVWVRDANVPSARLLLGVDNVDAEALLEEKRDAIAKSVKQRRRPSPASLKIDSERFGIVKSAAPFGLFVDVGVKSNGLIHFSKMGDIYRRDWQDSIPVGSGVRVRVIAVNGDRIELDLVSVDGDDVEEKQVSLALIRGPSAKEMEQTGSVNASERIPSVSTTKGSTLNGSDKEDAGQAERGIDRDDTDDMEEKERDEEEEDEKYDKFSEAYFEDKYGF